MEMCVKFLLGIQAQLSQYSDLSGNIEKYFGLGLWILFMGFYFDYEGLWWVFEIFRVASLKKVEMN